MTTNKYYILTLDKNGNPEIVDEASVLEEIDTKLEFISDFINNFEMIMEQVLRNSSYSYLNYTSKDEKRTINPILDDGPKIKF